jgi:hypothetical protein
MRREEYHDPGYVPDFIVTQAVLKRKLGITERRMIRDISVNGYQMVIDLGNHREKRIRYHLLSEEFKDKLGIDTWGNILLVRASVWSDKIEVIMSGGRPAESVRIR